MAEKRRLVELAEQKLGTRRSVEEAARLGSLSFEEDLAAQAAALCENEEEAGTSWNSEEEGYVDEKEVEELGLDRSELTEEKGQSRDFDPGMCD